MLVSVAKHILRKSFHAAGLEVQRRKPATSRKSGGENDVMPNVAEHPGLQRLIATRVQHPAILLGAARDLEVYRTFIDASVMEWDWSANVELPDGAQVVICSVPLRDEHWRAIRELKRTYGARVTTAQEIVLPFTPILFAQDKLNYFVKTIDGVAPFYMGEQWFGPIDRLHDLFPLTGRRVIEFGPFDGAQTAGLVHHGVRELICIEARAENFIKTLIAKEIFGWDHVRLVMDDMHNADEVKYGRFDLAFCHGTYYHTISPFVLLENLVSLSDNIFVGGFVLRDDAPFEIATYEGQDYRVQAFSEIEKWFTAGVNKTSYYFHPDDLMKFFSGRGYRITVMDDEENAGASKRFLRFLASR